VASADLGTPWPPSVRGSCAQLSALALLLISGIMTRDRNGFPRHPVERTTRAVTGGGRLFFADSVITDLMYVMTAVPLLFGPFWGAPLLAREAETARIAWLDPGRHAAHSSVAGRTPCSFSA
jgi:hypothetical protein